MACSCGCDKTKKGALLVYLGIFVLIVIVAIVGSCRGDRQKQPEAPKSAKERTQQKLEERMSDFDYTNTLHKLHMRQTELAKERAIAVRAYSAWYNSWVSTNESAKALVAKIAIASKDSISATNGVLAKLNSEMDALVAKDATGTVLKAKISAADSAIAQHQGEIHAFIGNKLLEQAKASKTQGAELARKQSESLQRLRAAQAAKNGGKAPVKPEVREEGWWTNSAPYKAAAAQAATNQPPKTATETK